MALLPSVGGAPVVESEVTLEREGLRRELLADPQSLRTLGTELRADPPKHLAGLIWFRLPLAGDRRAWPLVTLQAVLHQRALRSELQVTVQAQGDLYELRLVNQGNVSGAWPQHVAIAGTACEAGDGVQGYRLQRSADELEFVRQQPGQLAAGQSRALGWLRCSQLDQGGFRVTP